jgi:hypothetical protein
MLVSLHLISNERSGNVLRTCSVDRNGVLIMNCVEIMILRGLR